MSETNKNDSFLDQIMEAELKDPGALARLAAENAQKMAVAISKLGAVGEDNTLYSKQLMDATMSQIEQIQKLHGFSSDLPFQNNSYQVPDMMDAPLQNEGEIQTRVAEQNIKAEAANKLTKLALEEEGGPFSIPLIGLAASGIAEGVVEYSKTAEKMEEANVTAEEAMNLKK